MTPPRSVFRDQRAGPASHSLVILNTCERISGDSFISW
jgi:hypothetical protein